MRLAIIGSRRFYGSEVIYSNILKVIRDAFQATIQSHEPLVILSRGTAGVDTIVEEVASALGLEFQMQPSKSLLEACDYLCGIYPLRAPLLAQARRLGKKVLYIEC